MEKVYNFIKYKFIFLGFSATLITVFLISTFTLHKGFKMGIDFVGGVKIIAKFEKGVHEGKIRESLSKFDASVQQVGDSEKSEFIISVKAGIGADKSMKESDLISKKLNEDFKNVVFNSVEDVGPAIGALLKMDAIKAMVLAMVIMMIYLTFRFEFKYSLGVVLAVLHDIILSVGFCGMAGIEINIPIIAAILTIFGYSVNDTIIIFDRVRENMHIVSKKQTFLEVIDKSISQTLSRTLLTVLTTLFSVFAIFFLGGEGLNDFAKVMIFGLIFGTYSSYYIASPVVIFWEKYIAK